ncbi:hypothetical protein [Streptosporangium roseum]|uniref:hypothetical protein n=1 Tax=Streptosporangium roseum TaxID=2001 RepID=UPI003325AFB0
MTAIDSGATPGPGITLDFSLGIEYSSTTPPDITRFPVLVAQPVHAPRSSLRSAS